MRDSIFDLTDFRALVNGRLARLLIGLLLTATLPTVSALPPVIAFEGTVFPENGGWIANAFCEPPRALIDGWFQQEVAPCPGDPLPGGQQEYFQRGLGAFVGVSTFLEWRAETDGPSSEIIGVAPAAIVLSGNFGTSYHFTFARDQVRLIRDSFIPLVFVDLDPNTPHTFRLELDETEGYTWYIDGQIVDSGVPEGLYPQNDSAVILFSASCWYEPSTTRWNYVRFGVNPAEASGDFDVDGNTTLVDFHFFHECLANNGPGIFGGPESNAGPGCRFTDFDADSDVDLLDFAEFQNLFSALLR